MSNPAASHPSEGFHVVVAEDGSVPASELAPLGLRPGTHLRVVPEPRMPSRGRLAGSLASSVPAEAVEELLRGLDEAKAEREALYCADAS